MNLSISETLSRSIFTSLTTFIMVLCLFIMGVSSIREFALPLMVGIVAGAYSSICITGPLWFDFTARKMKKDDAKKAAEKAADKAAKEAKRSKGRQ